MTCLNGKKKFASQVFIVCLLTNFKATCDNLCPMLFQKFERQPVMSLVGRLFECRP